MDKLTAAMRLGVAEYTVVGLDLVDGWWTAEVRDAATHEITVRVVPGVPQEKENGGVVEPGQVYFVGEQGPEMIDVEVTVPDGTVAETMAWVGEDVERAQAALDAELAKDKPRSTLVAQLESLLGQ